MSSKLQAKGKLTSTNTSPGRNLLQRKCACGGTPGPTGACEACRKKRLQRKKINAGLETQKDSAIPPIVHEVLRSPGQPLDRETRAFMEPRFGHDFGYVRVHADARAAESARAVNALAYTVGREVVFDEGQYVPGTKQGRQLLAHELTHVVQQSGITCDLANLTVGEPNSGYEREAEAEENLFSPKNLGEGARLSTVQKISRPVIMRSHALPFTSTVKICHRLLESEEFKVSQGGLKVGIDARWQGPDEGAASCETHRRSPYDVTLMQKSLILDRGFGNCPFDPEKPSNRQWVGVPPDDYYLTIWTNNTNPNCCLEGVIEVSEQAGLAGASCTEIPDDALAILHTALDIAGLIPVLGAIPDALNAGIYAIEGDWVSAGISAVAIIPIFGEGVTVTKLGVKVTRAAVKRVGKEAIEVGLKEAKAAGKEIAGKGLGKAEKKITEGAAKKEGKEVVGHASEELAEKIPKEAAEKALKEKIKKCLAIYAAYNALGDCIRCKGTDTPAERAAKIACITSVIAGRESYMAMDCDEVLEGSIKKGIAKAKKGHQDQIEQFMVMLKNCSTLPTAIAP